jgi:NAD(P)-dependent dehydrogenase (short-subunit alcohol dehydrogenase family)
MMHPSKWTRCEEVQQAFPEGCADLRQGTTIVTGPTTGIGVTTAIALAAAGGRVVLAARSREKAEALANEIQASVPDAGPVMWIPLDLRSLRSVAHFAQVFGEMSDQGGWGPLKCLVANAGMFNMYSPHPVHALPIVLSVSRLALPEAANLPG